MRRHRLVLAESADPSTQQFNLTAECFDGPIERVVLLRPAALTHHFDNDQRYVELDFLPAAGQQTVPGVNKLTVTCPDELLMPPGYSVLYVIEKTAANNNLLPSAGGLIRFVP